MEIRNWVWISALFLVSAVGAQAQETQTASPQTVSDQQAITQTIPLLVEISGVLKDRMGKPGSGVLGVMFALYKDQEGGNPLWMETQNVQVGEEGLYSIALGSNHKEGIPLELFSSGQSRWLEVQVLLPGEEQQSRIQLVSVPYALKAGDADTLGGKPLSAFVLASTESATNADSGSRMNANSSYGKTIQSDSTTGNAIVSSPSSTQTINAPPKTGLVPLQINGNRFNNTLEIYDSQSPATLQSFFTPEGALVSKRAPTFSATAPGSVLFAGPGGLLSQDNTNLFWDNSKRGLRSGPPGSFFAESGDIRLRFPESLNHFLALNSGKTFALQVGNQDNSKTHTGSMIASMNDTHAAGTRNSVLGISASVYHSGAGDTLYLEALSPYIEHSGTGAATNLIVEAPYVSFGSYDPNSNAGPTTNLEVIRTGADISGVNNVTNVVGTRIMRPTRAGTGIVTNNYGLKIDRQDGIGLNNWSIKTEQGKVEFGDTVQANKNFVAAQRSLPFSATPVFDASTANSFKMTLGGDITSATLSNGSAGQIIVLLLCQDGFGNHSMTWPENAKLSGGAFPPTKTANRCDSWTGIYDGNNWNEISRAANIFQ